MPDVPKHERGIGIADAFAGLPLETPDRSAWPLLERRIIAASPTRPRPRWPFALAAAAALAAVAVMPRLMSPPGAVPAAPAVADVAESAGLNALMVESAQLENVISAMASDDVASASATVLGLEFEDRLRRLDIALSAPTLDADTRVLLWQQRVSLLREYAGIQGTNQWLAADGGTLDGALVATF